jgi:hypothetical protein
LYRVSHTFPSHCIPATMKDFDIHLFD